MPSPFYPRRPGRALRVLSAALVALSLGLPQPVLAADVTISGPVSGDVYGNSDSNDPTLRSGDPTGRILEVGIGGSVTGDAYGGQSDSGAVTSNSATVSGGKVSMDVFGGWSASGAATHNSATVIGGKVEGYVIGGSSFSGSATDNSVTVSGGKVSIDVIGGRSFGDATANRVTISGGSVYDVIGGRSFGDATANRVTISGGSIMGTVYGGDGYGAANDYFTGNTLIKDGNTTTDITVKNFQFINFGYDGDAGIASLDTTPKGSLAGGVTIGTDGHGVTISGEINGAGSLTKTGAGTLTLAGINTYSGGTAITGGGLTVIGTLGNGVYAGAIANSGALVFDLSSAQTLSGVISGTGSLEKASAGVLTLSDANTYTGMTTVRAGTLALANGGSLASRDLTLYGGAGFIKGGNHSLVDGSLTVVATGSPALYTGDLDASGATLNFIGGAASLTAGSLLSVSSNANISNSYVNVGTTGSTNLSVGDRLTLLTSTGALTAAGVSQGAGIATAGVTRVYGLALSADTTLNTLTATVTSVGARDGSKALSEGVLASAALVNRGGDMAAGEAMAQAVSAGSGGGMGGGFGAMSGGKARYNSGSHSDISSISLATGFAKGFELDQGQAVLGAFLEYGNGSYDAYNSFATGRTHGKGDMDYVGVGMLGRMDFAPEGPGHAYTEASLRLGRTHNKYDNADLGDGIGAHYKTSPAYYGGHVGAGYIWDIAPKTALDLSAKYLVTHQDASRVTLGSGDDIRFDSVTSRRTRLGGRLSYAATDRISPYAGAAWEYEFDARADATTSGIAITAPSLKGGTGIGELGVAIKPSTEMPLSLDFGLQGYAGKREGVTGSLKAVFRF